MRDIKRTFFDILLKTSPFTRIEEFICERYIVSGRKLKKLKTMLGMLLFFCCVLIGIPALTNHLSTIGCRGKSVYTSFKDSPNF